MLDQTVAADFRNNVDFISASHTHTHAHEHTYVYQQPTTIIRNSGSINKFVNVSLFSIRIYSEVYYCVFVVGIARRLPFPIHLFLTRALFDYSAIYLDV